MLIITGIGRCGTSLLAKFLWGVGYSMGGFRWNEKINAGMEYPASVLANTNLLGKINTLTTSEAREVILGIDEPVIKDPHIFRIEVLPTWLELRPNDKYLVLWKKPELHAREALVTGNRFRSFDEAVNNNIRVFSTCMDLLSRSGVAYRMFEFPKFLDTYDELHQVLVCFGGLQKLDDLGFKTCARKWDNLVDKSLVHYK